MSISFDVDLLINKSDDEALEHVKNFIECNPTRLNEDFKWGGKGTLLHFSCLWNKPKVVSYLLSKNPDVTKKFKDKYYYDGLTALEIAKELNYNSIVNLFNEKEILERNEKERLEKEILQIQTLKKLQVSQYFSKIAVSHIKKHLSEISETKNPKTRAACLIILEEKFEEENDVHLFKKLEPRFLDQIKDPFDYGVYTSIWNDYFPNIPPQCSHTPQSASIPSTQGFRNRFGFEENSGYKGVVATIVNFTPTKTCKEYIQELSKEEGCHKFGFILDDCENWIALNMQKPLFNPQNLDQNEVLALVIYAWDLGFNGEKEENFYFLLNKILRKRTPPIVRKWVGYLYFMQKALSKLPNLNVVVYRGVPDSKLIEDNYTTGRHIHWSAFCSTSTNLNAAREFATPTGIVLSIQILNGKSIQCYSPFGELEAEILLSPNMSFFVAQGIHQHDGYNRVVLVQVAPEKTFVF